MDLVLGTEQALERLLGPQDWTLPSQVPASFFLSFSPGKGWVGNSFSSAAQVAQRTVGRRVCNLIRMRLHLIPLACPTPFLAVAWPPIGDTWDPSRLATGAGGGRQHRGLNTSGELMGVQSREAEQGSQFYLF